MKKIAWALVGVVLAILVFQGYKYYRFIFAPNVEIEAEEGPYFYVYSTDTYEKVLKRLKARSYVLDENAFDWVAKQKKYPQLIKPGRYKLTQGMNNNELANLLRSGAQEPFVFTFNNLRTLSQLAGEAGQAFEKDSLAFLQVLKSDSIHRYYGFSEAAFPAMFIPNSYEFYWTTTPEKFVERMAKEFKAFWNTNRLQQAKAKGLSQSEVSTLASIVQSETQKVDEMPKVAGLYLNRLKRGMTLQADPTLIFALQDFSIKRVLNIHKKVDSPYNTYKYKGLPPGPISFAEIQAIDAVLHAENHDYLYMCAKEDFSGYHNFATSYTQHLANARRYQRELNKRRIYK